MVLDSQDYSYIDPYLMDWLKYVKESSDAAQQVIAEEQEFWIPYTGAPTNAINIIFKMNKFFSLDPYTKYLAVHILDKYMAKLFYRLISDKEMNESSQKLVYETIASQIKLVIASCLQIASKMNLYRSSLGISQIQALMRKLDSNRFYSSSAIFSSEVCILKSLQFQLPVCLPYETVELFIASAGLGRNPLVHETCVHLLDIAYLRHTELMEQLHLMARSRKYDKARIECRDFLRLEANSAFIAAAVVVCSNFFLLLKRSIVDELAAKLARLIDMNAIDVNIMANLLFTFALDEEDFKEVQQSQVSSGDEVN